MIEELLAYYKTINVPEVNFDTNNGYFCLSGKSVFENTGQFYVTLIKQFNKYATSPQSHTMIEFKLEYFNTSSAAWILKLFYAIDELHQSGQSVTVTWYYASDDEDMQEAGADFAEMVSFDLHLQKAAA